MFKKILATVLMCTALSSAANVVIVGTRIIYPADQKSVNVQLKNTAKNPSLVQAWIDEGDDTIDPNKSKAPFLITPPMTRVEGNAGQSLRIFFTGKGLPQDRETVFYFNLLDVPPKPKASDLGDNPNYLQFAIRSRLKLFYRPTKLSINVEEAYKEVTWTAKGGDNIEVNNPTPYHITYDEVNVNSKVSHNMEMLAPFSKTTVKIPTAKRGNKVLWKAINDYGGFSEGESLIQ